MQYTHKISLNAPHLCLMLPQYFCTEINKEYYKDPYYDK